MRLITVLFYTVLLCCCKAETSLNDYQKTEIVISKVCNLPSETYESSGIIFFQGLLWTINDSGNEAILFGIDTVSGKIVRKVEILTASNIDWEAITQDENNIYIADNGNNNRTRSDYTIYVIPKDSISVDFEQQVKPKKTITYNYRESDLVLIDLDKTSVNSEAILVDDNSIFVYTKDSKFSSVSAFSLPIFESNGECQLGGSYNLGFAVTAATRIDINRIAFLGYKGFSPFLTILETDPMILGSVIEIAQYELLELQGLQTEGLTYESGNIYISCENFIAEQALYRIEFK